MSTYDRNRGMGRLPSWRSNEPLPERVEAARPRGPVVRPADFVREAPAAAAEEKVETVRAAPAEIVREDIDRRIRPPAAAYNVETRSEFEFVTPRETVPPPPPPKPQPPTPSSSTPVEAVAVAVPAPPAAQLTVMDEPLLDARLAVRAIWAMRLPVLILAVLGAVLGATLLPRLPQKFTAEASLYFDPRQASASDSQTTTAPELIGAMIDSQTQILASGKVLGRVVDALKLDTDPQFTGGIAGPAAHYVAVSALQKAVLIAREASTYVVTLKVTTPDPEKSARIANQIVTSFMEEESGAATKMYTNANTALDSRLEDLRQQVLNAEKAVSTYRADNDMAAVQGDLISDKRLTSLNDLLLTAQQKTIEAKSRADAIQKLSVQDVVGTPQAGDTSATSAALANLRQQYSVQAAAVGSLESQLGARHPRLQAARSSLDSIGGEIRSELQRLATSATGDYEQAQRAERDIGKELMVQKAAQANTSIKLVELDELQRKAAAAREIYEALMKRSGQVGDNQNLAQTNVRVISEAQPPLKADGAGKKVLMIAGLIAGGLAGVSMGIALAIIFALLRHPVIRSYLPKSGKAVAAG